MAPGSFANVYEERSRVRIQYFFHSLVADNNRGRPFLRKALRIHEQKHLCLSVDYCLPIFGYGLKAFIPGHDYPIFFATEPDPFRVANELILAMRIDFLDWIYRKS